MSELRKKRYIASVQVDGIDVGDRVLKHQRTYIVKSIYESIEYKGELTIELELDQTRHRHSKLRRTKIQLHKYDTIELVTDGTQDFKSNLLQMPDTRRPKTP